MTADDHLSVTRVRDNLIATLPPHPADSTIDELQKRILTRINQSTTEEIEAVILDVTPVQTVDSFLARTIIETAKMVELMGVHPVLVGITPSIAITATELGFGLGDDIDTALSIDVALDILGENSHESNVN